MPSEALALRSPLAKEGYAKEGTRLGKPHPAPSYGWQAISQGITSIFSGAFGVRRSPTLGLPMMWTGGSAITTPAEAVRIPPAIVRGKSSRSFLSPHWRTATTRRAPDRPVRPSGGAAAHRRHHPRGRETRRLPAHCRRHRAWVCRSRCGRRCRRRGKTCPGRRFEQLGRGCGQKTTDKALPSTVDGATTM